MYKYLIALILSIAYPMCSSSQNIYGTVIGEHHTKLSLATVALLEKSDSSFISGVVSNDDGGFSFKTNPANRLIKVSCVGYKTTIVSAADSVTILLHSLEQNIKEVTVTASRPTFKMSQGMFISSIQ